MLLNKVASVMQVTCTYIAAGSFQRMSVILHFLPILCVYSIGYIFHGLVESHIFELGEHHIKHGRNASQLLYCFLYVDRRWDVEIGHCYLYLQVSKVLLLLILVIVVQLRGRQWCIIEHFNYYFYNESILYLVYTKLN